MPIHFRLRLPGALALCLLIAAGCGGGGGGGSASAPGVASVPDVTPIPHENDREPEDDGAGQAPAAIDDGAPTSRDPQYYALVLSRRLDEVSLALYEQGTFRKLETPWNSHGYQSKYSFDKWGFEAREGDRVLFNAYVTGGPAPGPDATGEWHRTNPVSGSASWSGRVRAVEVTLNDARNAHVVGEPVTGTARLTMDFSAARVSNGLHIGKVDVDITNLTRGHANISWRDLRVTNGSFKVDELVTANIPVPGRNIYNFILGYFYGSSHQGAAGSFMRNGLRGVFGTLRD